MSSSDWTPLRVQVVGRGRMGSALDHALRESALREAGVTVLPIAGRGADGTGADLVLLAVPDGEIATAGRGITPGPLVGHLSGITSLGVLGTHEGFGLHPLLTVTGPQTVFDGAFAAVAGTSERALDCAEQLAARLGLHPFRIADEDRGAYHAAASIAANFLVTLEGSAEALAATAGVPREALVPLAIAALHNWASQGAAAALTGPIIRGDDATVQMQRAAIATRAPEQLPMFDALVTQTRRIATSQPRSSAAQTAREGDADGAA